MRVVFTRPKVGVKKFMGGLVRDYGFTAKSERDATWNSLQDMCRVRRGRRSPDWNSPDGPDDYLDQDLLARVQRITFCGASDGAAVAIDGI